MLVAPDGDDDKPEGDCGKGDTGRWRKGLPEGDCGKGDKGRWRKGCRKGTVGKGIRVDGENAGEKVAGRGLLGKRDTGRW